MRTASLASPSISSTNTTKRGRSTRRCSPSIPTICAAHYILSIVYRRLGMKEQATRESAAFADQKDDPTASTYALEFLRKHPEITSESVPWHTHSGGTTEPGAGGGAGSQ